MFKISNHMLRKEFILGIQLCIVAIGKFCILVAILTGEIFYMCWSLVNLRNFYFGCLFGMLSPCCDSSFHVFLLIFVTLFSKIIKISFAFQKNVQNIRGQGYDGASSDMYGRWNGLQALFWNECPFAYYIFCFAYWLQLALLAASKEVRSISGSILLLSDSC